MTTRPQTTKKEVVTSVRGAVFTGVLLGIGIAGFLDEAIFHQILQWHTFYWPTTSYYRIFSDGLFHVVSTLLLLWGAWRLWRGRADWSEATRNITLAGILIGGGGFNFYDGIIQHALFHFHYVNELVCNTAAMRADTVLGVCRNDLPYEIVWDIVALVILGSGLLLLRRSRRLER